MLPNWTIWRQLKCFNNQKSPKSKLQTVPELNMKMNFNFSTLLFQLLHYTHSVLIIIFAMFQFILESVVYNAIVIKHTHMLKIIYITDTVNTNKKFLKRQVPLCQTYHSHKGRERKGSDKNRGC